MKITSLFCVWNKVQIVFIKFSAKNVSKNGSKTYFDLNIVDISGALFLLRTHLERALEMSTIFESQSFFHFSATILVQSYSLHHLSWDLWYYSWRISTPYLLNPRRTSVWVKWTRCFLQDFVFAVRDLVLVVWI